MFGNQWDQPGVSYKGWYCVDFAALRADGEPADETDYATCQMSVIAAHLPFIVNPGRPKCVPVYRCVPLGSGTHFIY
jgi:hypothetical protein